jgi:hypothetical protein
MLPGGTQQCPRTRSKRHRGSVLRAAPQAIRRSALSLRQDRTVPVQRGMRRARRTAGRWRRVRVLDPAGRDVADREAASRSIRSPHNSCRYAQGRAEHRGYDGGRLDSDWAVLTRFGFDWFEGPQEVTVSGGSNIPNGRLGGALAPSGGAGGGRDRCGGRRAWRAGRGPRVSPQEERWRAGRDCAGLRVSG